MLFLGQAEGENCTIIQKTGRSLLHILIFTHPDRTQPENRDLPDVPVAEPVKAEQFIEGTEPGCVPPTICATISGRGQQGCEYPLPLDEVDKVGIPDPVEIVLLKASPSLGLEKSDGLTEDVIQCRIGMVFNELFRVEQKHSYSSIKG